MSNTARHPRHDFLIERVAFFSDAVFAIAITLMAIEIHPPVVNKGDSDAAVWQEFKHLLPEFAGLLVSFILIGLTWLRHHQMFRYVDNYDMRFMIINLGLLFFVVLFPFSNAFLFNSIFDGGTTKLQVLFYLGVPMCCNLMLYRLYRLVNKKHLKGAADADFRRATFSLGGMTISFLLAIVWVIIAPVQYHMFGYMFLGVGPMIDAFNRKKFKTK